MNKETEAGIAWRKHFEQVAKYDYSRAEKQTEESAQYVQGVSAHSRVYGMNDFKASLREEIDKRKVDYQQYLKDATARGLVNDKAIYVEKIKTLIYFLQLLDTVKPKTVSTP